MNDNDDKTTAAALVAASPYRDSGTGRYGLVIYVDGVEHERMQPFCDTEHHAHMACGVFLSLLEAEMTPVPGVTSQRVRVETEGARQ